MQQSDLEQQPFAVLHGGVTRRREEDGCPPAFLINVPIARNLAAVRSQLVLNCSVSGLYEASPRPGHWRAAVQPLRRYGLFGGGRSGQGRRCRSAQRGAEYGSAGRRRMPSPAVRSSSSCRPDGSSIHRVYREPRHLPCICQHS
ncbi:hypothetical protein GCM10022232_87640 [Streptomyces plumbiresistens]|uniref:Uncharacterized protein n=1 Tax=Streptomyces plumbiresistens TaxID=511811 RepID=A0ABP7TM25_9ACTN